MVFAFRARHRAAKPGERQRVEVGLSYSRHVHGGDPPHQLGQQRQPLADPACAPRALLGMVTEEPTPEEIAIVSRHVEYLETLGERGTLLAGRTEANTELTFGIMIF